MGAFEDGREFEGLVRQIKEIYREIDKAKEREEIKEDFPKGKRTC